MVESAGCGMNNANGSEMEEEEVVEVGGWVE